MLSLCEGGTCTYLQQIRLRRALPILLKLLTRRLSVILERLGPVGVIQTSTLVHYQRGGGRARAGGGQGSSRARANAMFGGAGGQRGGGGRASYVTIISRIPFPFAIDLMPN